MKRILPATSIPGVGNVEYKRTTLEESRVNIFQHMTNKSQWEHAMMHFSMMEPRSLFVKYPGTIRNSSFIWIYGYKVVMRLLACPSRA